MTQPNIGDRIECRIHGVWQWHPLIAVDRKRGVATVNLADDGSTRPRELPITRPTINGFTNRVENGAYIG